MTTETPMKNIKFLTVLGEMIVEASDDSRTSHNIREMHSTREGAEILRLMVRDNLGGSADVITDALMHQMMKDL